MQKARAVSFCTGRTIIGLVTVLMGLQTLLTGQEAYDESLHELRKTYLPNIVAATERVLPQYQTTWEELNLYLIKGEGLILVLGGLLILMNRRCLGSLLLVIAVTFILIVKDNPWLRHNSMKSSQKEVKEKFNNFVENLGLLGSALLLMFHRGASRC